MKIKIIYGTETGTTQYVASIVQKRLSEAGHEVDLYQAGVDTAVVSEQGYDLMVFGSPTYYGGQLESKMEMFLSQFNPDLSNIKVAVFSLGDQSYGDFCASAEIIEGWIKAHQGQLLCPSLKIDGYPENVESINTWVTQLLK